VSWLKYCLELVPQDIRLRLMTTYILNANALMQRYLRRLYNVSAGASMNFRLLQFPLMLPLTGTHFGGVLRTCSCVAELQEHGLPAGCIAPLVYASMSTGSPCLMTVAHILKQLALRMSPAKSL
jgi:hypothetical protein